MPAGPTRSKPQKWSMSFRDPVVPLEKSPSEHSSQLGILQLHSSACSVQNSCVAFAYPTREGSMETVPSSFAHVLLFACPRCGVPLASACASTDKNLEAADAHWFDPHCPCGWTGSVIGVEAVKHWVEAWNIPVSPGPNAAGSCDSEPSN